MSREIHIKKLNKEANKREKRHSQCTYRIIRICWAWLKEQGFSNRQLSYGVKSLKKKNKST